MFQTRNPAVAPTSAGQEAARLARERDEEEGVHYRNTARKAVYAVHEVEGVAEGGDPEYPYREHQDPERPRGPGEHRRRVEQQHPIICLLIVPLSDRQLVFLTKDRMCSMNSGLATSSSWALVSASMAPARSRSAASLSSRLLALIAAGLPRQEDGRHLVDGRRQALRRDDVVHEAEARGVGGGDRRRGEDELLGPSQPHRPLEQP